MVVVVRQHQGKNTKNVQQKQKQQKSTPSHVRFQGKHTTLYSLILSDTMGHRKIKVYEQQKICLKQLQYSSYLFFKLTHGINLFQVIT